MRFAEMGRILGMAAWLVLGSVISAKAVPLSCEALQTRLIAQFYNDTELNSKPTVSKSESDTLPSFNVVDIKSADIQEGDIWCKKTDKSVEHIEISFDVPNLVLPSRNLTAEAIIADIVCTLMKAELHDCDYIVKEVSKRAGVRSEGRDATIHLAPRDWVITAERTRSDLTFDFFPGDNSGIDPHRIDLN